MENQAQYSTGVSKTRKPTLSRAKRVIGEIDLDCDIPKARKKRAPAIPEQLEKGITKAIRCILDTIGLRHWKQHQGLGSTPGIPDIVGLKKVKVADLVASGAEYVGVFVGIEVKRPSIKTLRPAQERWKRLIQESGGIFLEARSVDDVIDGLGIRNRFLF
jgi:hypothetical protein